MIRNIIFDLGNVLVNVDYSNFKIELDEQGVSEKLYNSFFTGGNYRSLGYEAGKITTDEFAGKCINSLELNMSTNEFCRAFNDMFTEIKPMSELVRKLATEKKYNLFLLSNTSPLHFETVLKDYDYINLLDKFAVSYKLKALKPDAEIYHKALALFNAKDDECIFIDDLKENCEGAESAGIKSIQYDLKNHTAFEEKFFSMINY